MVQKEICGIVMIGIQIKNLEDFKRLVEDQKTVFVKKTPDKFTYYVVSNHSGVGVVNAFTTDRSLNFNEDFNPEKPDGIHVGFLVEIESITTCEGGFQ